MYVTVIARSEATVSRPAVPLQTLGARAAVLGMSAPAGVKERSEMAMMQEMQAWNESTQQLSESQRKAVTAGSERLVEMVVAAAHFSCARVQSGPSVRLLVWVWIKR